MKELVKKSGFISLLSSIVFLLLGIILVNHPEDTIKVVSYILGGLLMAFGIIRLFTYFTSRDKFQYYDFNLMLGSLCLLVGLVILVFGTSIASIFGIIVGIWIVLSSINRMNLSFKLKDSGIKYWYISLIIAILVFISGLYVVFSPELILVTLGTILIIYSITDIIQSIIFIINTNKIFKE
ncbi:MAG: DUF308 domain-containing protein [Clostridia bacterium]|nr:DUF308 domain-containing protein [Clostridia bacterium]